MSDTVKDEVAEILHLYRTNPKAFRRAKRRFVWKYGSQGSLLRIHAYLRQGGK